MQCVSSSSTAASRSAAASCSGRTMAPVVLARGRTVQVAAAARQQGTFGGKAVAQRVSLAATRRAGRALVQAVYAVKDGAVLDRPLRVAVIGGGPSGACAAETLAAKGIETYLIERKMDNCKVLVVCAAQPRCSQPERNNCSGQHLWPSCKSTLTQHALSAAHRTASLAPSLTLARLTSTADSAFTLAPTPLLSLQPCGGAIPLCMVQEFDLPESIIDRKVTKMKMISPSNREVDVGRTLSEREYIGMCRREVRTHPVRWLILICRGLVVGSWCCTSMQQARAHARVRAR